MSTPRLLLLSLLTLAAPALAIDPCAPNAAGPCTFRAVDGTVWQLDVPKGWRIADTAESLAAGGQVGIASDPAVVAPGQLPPSFAEGKVVAEGEAMIDLGFYITRGTTLIAATHNRNATMTKLGTRDASVAFVDDGGTGVTGTVNVVQVGDRIVTVRFYNRHRADGDAVLAQLLDSLQVVK